MSESMRYKFFFDRVVYFIVLFFITVTVGFALPRLIPGNPAEAVIARLSANGAYVSPTLIKAIDLELGISHQPLYIQYFSYLSNLFHGNLGVSIIYFPEPVATIIADSFWWTIFLVVVPIVISFYVGNYLGRVAALSRGTWKDSLSTLIPMFMYGIPAFAFAVILMLIFAVDLNVVPALNAYKLGLTPGLNLTFISSVAYHAILPVSTLVLTTLSGWVFGMRNNMVTILNSDFLKFSELMGVKKKIMRKNATRNAILPNMTSFGISIGVSITGVILIQQIFSYQGLGEYLYQGIEGLDYPLVNGIFIVIVLISLVANFITEILYGIMDPRIRSDSQ